MKKLWGEDKIYFEEAIAGGLMAAAGAAAFVAPFMDAITFQNILAGSFGLTEKFTLLAITVAGLGGFTLIGWQKAEWIYGGTEYIDDPLKGKLILQANEKKLMSKVQKNGSVKGWEIGGVEFSRMRMVSHIRINGLPGAGKTVLINSIIYQTLANSNEKVVIHDSKGDFTTWVYDAKDTVMMGPWDSRFSGWDISADITNPPEAMAIASILASSGVDKNNMSGSSKYFIDIVTDIIGGYFNYLMMMQPDNWSWDTISDDIMNNRIVEKARIGDPKLRSSIPKSNGDQIQNVISSLTTAIGWIPAYAVSLTLYDNEDGTINKEKSNLFSIKKWLAKTSHQDVRKIIFNNNKNYEKQSQQVFGVMYSVMASYICGSDMPNIGPDDENALSIISDEIIQLGGDIVKTIANIEEFGRSRGIRVVKATQDESQTTALLGRDAGQAANSVQQTKIYLKTANGTASEIAKSFGTNTQVRVEAPVLAGSGNKRIIKDDKHDVINMSDFTGLEVIPGTGVEIIVNIDKYLVKLVQPFLDKNLMEEKNLAFLSNNKFLMGNLKIALDLHEKNEEEFLNDQPAEGRVVDFNNDDKSFSDSKSELNGFNSSVFDNFLLPKREETSDLEIDFSTIKPMDFSPELLAIFSDVGSDDASFPQQGR